MGWDKTLELTYIEHYYRLYMLICGKWFNLNSPQWGWIGTGPVLADIKCIVKGKKDHSVLVTCSSSPSPLQNLGSLICKLVLWIFKKGTEYAESSSLFGTTLHPLPNSLSLSHILPVNISQITFGKCLSLYWWDVGDRERINDSLKLTQKF